MATQLGSVMQDALVYKYPGAEFVCGETYESLQWLDKNVAKPTLEELQAAIADFRANKNSYMYKVMRAEEYPTIGDQLDALWHAMDTGILPQVTGFYDLIKAVKVKYPKKV